ncbi:MAG: SGNH/GDSL hydrolase family protein [Flavobacteriaceae bacterium]|nr:SGNH/GDSL hydrolase family protein [Flavobacteriaceae bacterium]
MLKTKIFHFAICLLLTQQFYAQKKDPLEGIDFTETLMYLDWSKMDYFDTLNKEVVLGNNSGRVVFMGNSITQGWKHYMPEMFDNQTYINRGIGGQTTPQMFLRFRQDVIAHKPEIVVILAGTNDIAGNTPLKDLETVAGYIFSMAELANANGIKVIVSSVIPAADYPWRSGKNPDVEIPKLNQMIKDYCTENNFKYLDYFSSMTNGKNGLIESYGYDGVHPNKKGYEIMTVMVEEAIQDLLSP